MAGVAILIDGDNIPPSYMPIIIGTAKQEGMILIKRLYAGMTISQAWRDVSDTFGITVKIATDLTKAGKNAADINLIIDAMDILYTNNHIQTFCIVSADSDFTRLYTRLKESGKRVVAMGKQNTPMVTQNMCDMFIRMDAYAKAKKASEFIYSFGESISRNDISLQIQNKEFLNILKNMLQNNDKITDSCYNASCMSNGKKLETDVNAENTNANLKERYTTIINALCTIYGKLTSGKDKNGYVTTINLDGMLKKQIKNFSYAEYGAKDKKGLFELPYIKRYFDIIMKPAKNGSMIWFKPK